VTYSFAVTNPDGSLDLSGSGEQAGLTAFVTAAQKNKVKALASVGGWSGSIYWSSNVATAENRTAFVKTLSDFASTNKLDGLDFDWEYPTGGGMSCNVANTADTANYLLFLQELRKANPSLILTAAAGIAPWKDATGSPSADVSGFAKVLNYVAIMNYDEYGQWSATAGPNSALDDSCASPAAQQGSAMSAVKAWTAAGMPANQLVLGVASYGHAFNVAPSAAFAGTPPPSTASATASATMSSAANPSATDATSTDDTYSTDASATDAPSSTDSAGAPDATATISDAYANSNINYRRRNRRHDGDDDSDSGSPSSGNGTLALFPQYTKWQYAADETPATECGKPAQKDVSYTFAALVQAGYLTDAGVVASGFASTFDTCSQTPFLYDQSKQMLVSYDDARAFAAKGSYIKSAGLLGFAMWEASGDHGDILLDSIRAAVSGTSPPSTSSSSSSALSNSGTASATPTTTVQSSTVTDTPYPTESSHCDGMN